MAIALVTPADAVQAAKQVLFWLTLLLLALTAVYGVVHGIAWTQRRVHLATPELIPPTELAILNWRRQKSVFLGTNQPQEDASWVFQLRMAELERAKVCRTSEPRPWNRLSARLFDYALWGLILAVPLSELRSIGVVSSETRLLAQPSAVRADADDDVLGSGRGHADRLDAHDARQVALRRVPAVLDQRRLRLARRLHAVPARAGTLGARLVGGRGLRRSRCWRRS